MTYDKQEQHKTKMNLVADLESIKASLTTEEEALDLQNIPTLQDAIIEDKPPPLITRKKSSERFFLEECSPEEPSQKPSLPGQQSLFDHENDPGKPIEEPNPQPSQRIPKAKGENPFLPQHIRERLKSNNPELIQAIAKTADSLLPRQNDSSLAAKSSQNSDSIVEKEQLNHTLVDKLVKEYLPKIEAELRQRLQASLNSEK